MRLFRAFAVAALRYILAALALFLVVAALIAHDGKTDTPGPASKAANADDELTPRLHTWVVLNRGVIGCPDWDGFKKFSDAYMSAAASGDKAAFAWTVAASGCKPLYPDSTMFWVEDIAAWNGAAYVRPKGGGAAYWISYEFYHNTFKPAPEAENSSQEHKVSNAAKTDSPTAASNSAGFCTAADWGLKSLKIECVGSTTSVNSVSAPVQTEMPVADTPPNLEITVEPYEGGSDFKTLVISPRENFITIRDISVNRGNCKPNSVPPLPQTLRFGQRFKIGLFSRSLGPPYGCLPIEVDVLTDKGKHRFSFGYDGDTTHLEVRTEHIFDDFTNIYLNITSHDDSITVRSILVNRGNCQPYNPVQLPVTLKFGNVLKGGMFSPYTCLPAEVSISTDKGEHTFSMRH